MDPTKIKRFRKLKWPLRIGIIFLLLLIILWGPVLMWVTLHSSMYNHMRDYVYSDKVTVVEVEEVSLNLDFAKNWKLFQRNGLCFQFGDEPKINNYFEDQYYVYSEDSQTTFAVDFRHMIPQIEALEPQTKNLDVLIDHYGKNLSMQFALILQAFEYEEPSHMQMMFYGMDRLYLNLAMVCQKHLMPTLVKGEKIVYVYRGEDRRAMLCPTGEDHFIYIIWLDDHDVVFQGWMTHKSETAQATFQAILNSSRICGDFHVSNVEYPGMPGVGQLIDEHLEKRKNDD